MKKITILAMSLFLSILIAVPANAEATIESQYFTDTEGNVNFSEIEWLAENEIVQGYEDKTFKPTNYISRAEFLKILTLANGMDLPVDPNASEITFSDVNTEDWFHEFVEYAVSRGIINGYPDGTFKPHQNILYPEAFKIISISMFNQDIVLQDCISSSNSWSYDEQDCPNLWYWPHFTFSWNYNFFPETHKENFYETVNWRLQRGDMAKMIFRARAIKETEINGEYLAFRSPLYPSSLNPNESDFLMSKIKVGDTIKGLTVKSVSPASGTKRTALNTKIEFEGEFELDVLYKLEGEELHILNPSTSIPSPVILEEKENNDLPAYNAPIVVNLSSFYKDQITIEAGQGIFTLENLIITITEDGKVARTAELLRVEDLKGNN
jgi:hypothetical protein